MTDPVEGVRSDRERYSAESFGHFAGGWERNPTPSRFQALIDAILG